MFGKLLQPSEDFLTQNAQKAFGDRAPSGLTGGVESAVPDTLSGFMWVDDDDDDFIEFGSQRLDYKAYINTYMQ